MAITFIQEKKRQRYLILILALVIFSILLLVWWGFFRVEGPGQPEVSVPVFVPKKIEIDWQTLKSPQLKELEAFEKIGEFEGEIGRENPFILY